MPTDTALKQRIDIAAGRQAADLVLSNCRIVDVFGGTVIHGNIAIHAGIIIGIGNYSGKKVLDMNNAYVAPGLIDSHIHMESSIVTPEQLARIIVPRGTTTLIADPHEIVNVCGTAGLKFLIDSTAKLPMDTFFMLPSCVPATEFETSGAAISAADIAELINSDSVLGLGELMNYVGTVMADKDILAKIRAAGGKKIDGHAPLLSAQALNAYIISGVKTDHECSNAQEMTEKLSAGMYIAIREGSAARDLAALIPHITPHNERRCTLCTDDKHPCDILKEGHIDFNIRKAVSLGLDPITAIKMATLNTAECYGLPNRGAIAPGYRADLIVFDDFDSFTIKQVYQSGRLVAQDGKALFAVVAPDITSVADTVKIREITEHDLQIPLTGESVHVIQVQPHSLLTACAMRRVARNEKGCFTPDPNADILKLAVIERHGKNGSIGLGLIENLHIKNGAIGTTIAHDSHNLIVAGDNDRDMLAVINEIKKIGGGMAIAADDKIIGSLALPVAGIMSNLTMEIVSDKITLLKQLVYERLGANRSIDALMTLSFMALPVIPDIKLTDKGLFDVRTMSFMDINA